MGQKVTRLRRPFPGHCRVLRHCCAQLTIKTRIYDCWASPAIKPKPFPINVLSLPISASFSVTSSNFSASKELISSFFERKKRTPKTGLNNIYRKYGHIERVYLTNGEIFVGALVESGDKIILVTKEGKRTINKSSINKIEYSIKCK